MCLVVDTFIEKNASSPPLPQLLGRYWATIWYPCGSLGSLNKNVFCIATVLVAVVVM